MKQIFICCSSEVKTKNHKYANTSVIPLVVVIIVISTFVFAFTRRMDDFAPLLHDHHKSANDALA